MAKRIITAEELETRIQNATSGLDADALVDLHNLVSTGKVKFNDNDQYELTFDSDEDEVDFEDDECS